MANPWSLYMIECRGGGIYTGIAIDVDERFKTHVAGKGAKYTKMNPPLRIIARQRFPDRRSAAQAEYAMKRLTPLEKRQWAFSMNGARQTKISSENLLNSMNFAPSVLEASQG